MLDNIDEPIFGPIPVLHNFPTNYHFCPSRLSFEMQAYFLDKTLLLTKPLPIYHVILRVFFKGRLNAKGPI